VPARFLPQCRASLSRILFDDSRRLLPAFLQLFNDILANFTVYFFVPDQGFEFGDARGPAGLVLLQGVDAGAKLGDALVQALVGSTSKRFSCLQCLATRPGRSRYVRGCQLLTNFRTMTTRLRTPRRLRIIAVLV
jgi:hypothetical protein